MYCFCFKFSCLWSYYKLRDLSKKSILAFSAYDSWGLPVGSSDNDPRGNSGNNDITTHSTLRMGVRQLNLATSFAGFKYPQLQTRLLMRFNISTTKAKTVQIKVYVKIYFLKVV